MGDVDGILTFLIQFFTIDFSEMITVFLIKNSSVSSSKYLRDRLEIDAISIRFSVKRIYYFSWPIFRCPILYQNIPWTFFVHGMMTKGIQLRWDLLRQKLRPLVLEKAASPFHRFIWNSVEHPVDEKNSIVHGMTRFGVLYCVEIRRDKSYVPLSLVPSSLGSFSFSKACLWS